MFNDIEMSCNNSGLQQQLSKAGRLVSGLVIAAICAGLVALVALAPKNDLGLTEAVYHSLPASGVENPITAVLLNFRSYDTLLEIAVLLIVAIALMPKAAAERRVLIHKNISREPVLTAVLRIFIPITVLASGYILWTGSYEPGGAFQAGALLAGAGILMSLGGYQFSLTSLAAKILMVLGLSTFLLVAAGVALVTGSLLTYPQEFAGLLILLIESAATLSIAVILEHLYCSLISPESARAADPVATNVNRVPSP